jgi:integrase
MMLAKDCNGSKYGKPKQSGGRDGCFRALLIALRHSGARPGTVSAVRKEDVSEDGQRWVLEDHKTRHKTGKPLTIYLSPCLQTLTRILSEERASGPLFLNSKSKPWTKDSIRQRMGDLKEKLKIEGKFVAYSYRHTYATTALTSGTDLATVAELLGHTSTDMVMRVYGHLDQKKEHMQQAAAKVHGGKG